MSASKPRTKHQRGRSADVAKFLFRSLLARLGFCPIVVCFLRVFERFLSLEAGRHGGCSAGENLVVLDAEGAQPALLSHGQRDEITDLNQLGLAEMLVQAGPELIVNGQIPGDGFGISERRLLPLVIAPRALEIDEVAVIVLNEPLGRRLDRALIAAEFAKDGSRHIDAAQLLDGVISDPILENVPPTVCERPEDRRHMGADGLALGPWRAFPRAPFNPGKHRCVIDAGGVDIADAGLGHPISSWVPAWPLCERWQLFIQHAVSLDRAPGAAFDQRHLRIIYQSP